VSQIVQKKDILRNLLILNVEMQKVKYSREENTFGYKNSLHGSKTLVGQSPHRQGFMITLGHATFGGTSLGG
jgi:hypothetical protein